MDGQITTSDWAWRASQHCAVHQALLASLDSGIRTVAPGAEAAIARALVYFRMKRDPAIVGRLETIALTIVRLRQSLAEAGGDHLGLRAELARQTRAWLACAPMFPAAEAPALERVAA